MRRLLYLISLAPYCNITVPFVKHCAITKGALCGVSYLFAVWLLSMTLFHTIKSSSPTLSVVVRFFTIFVDYILIDLRLLLLTYLFLNPLFIYRGNSITAKSQLARTINFFPTISF